MAIEQIEQIGEIGQDEIKTLIPHRYPMLLVDRVKQVVPGERIVAIKEVSHREFCFPQEKTHAIDTYAYPNSLLIESMGQSAAILCSVSLRARAEAIEGVVLLGALSNFKFYGDVFPGDTVEHRVVLSAFLSSAAICTGTAWVGERLIAETKKILVLRNQKNIGSAPSV